MTFKFGTSAAEWSPDKDLLARLKRAYKIGVENYLQPNGSIWGTIGNSHRIVFHSAIMNDNDDELGHLLSNPAKTELYYGLDPLSLCSVTALHENPTYPSHLETTIVKHVDGLLDSIAARRLANPESNTPSEAFDTERLINMLDGKFGFAVSFPNPLPYEYGLQTSRGLISFKVPMALCQAYRLLKIFKMVGGSKVLEIGPGIARTAYFSRCAGISDYTTVDIPSGILAQASWLAPVLGPDALWLPGDDEGLQEGRIKLLLPHMLEGRQFDVALNADSITEMPVEQAIEYFRFCSQHCKALLSTNHECNSFIAGDLGKLAGTDFEPIRSISTIRQGYVDELFIFDSSEAAELRKQVDGLRKDVEELKASKSWKMTAPIRAVKTYLSS